MMTLDNFSKVFAMEPSYSQNKCARMLHKNNKHNNRDDIYLTFRKSTNKNKGYRTCQE